MARERWLQMVIYSVQNVININHHMSLHYNLQDCLAGVLIVKNVELNIFGLFEDSSSQDSMPRKVPQNIKRRTVERKQGFSIYRLVTLPRFTRVSEGFVFIPA
eukprot:GEMP01123992.1.p2 GENE.GEMP01123992.1~~GEMP01123992.1.p2  ORF type:complete len:103 (+),score=4.29 GEMP01123992.1:255-563(+)